MMSNMNDHDWQHEFIPQANPFDKNASYTISPEHDEGCMFETFGVELDYIKDIIAGKVEGLSSKNIWTLLDSETPDELSDEGEALMAAGWDLDEEEGEWVMDGENLNTQTIVSGFHFVNRIGYFVTEKPLESDEECVVYDEEFYDAIIESQRVKCRNGG